MLVSGEAGIGKSRLVAQLLKEAEGKIPVRYFAAPHQQGMPLQPVLQQMERDSRMHPSDGPPQRIEKLRAILPDLRPVDFALVAEQMSLQGHGLAAIPPMPPQRRRERLLPALTEGLAATTRLRPVLMVLEDAHWADPTTRKLLALWMERVPTLRVLAVITARPEFVPAWLGAPGVERLTLMPLAEAEAAELVRGIARDVPLPPAIARDILRRADGVPLFLEELTRAVTEQIAQAGGIEGLVPRRTTERASVPVSLHASLLARLDRLGRGAAGGRGRLGHRPRIRRGAAGPGAGARGRGPRPHAGAAGGVTRAATSGRGRRRDLPVQPCADSGCRARHAAARALPVAACPGRRHHRGTLPGECRGAAAGHRTSPHRGDAARAGGGLVAARARSRRCVAARWRKPWSSSAAASPCCRRCPKARRMHRPSSTCSCWPAMRCSACAATARWRPARPMTAPAIWPRRCRASRSCATPCMANGAMPGCVAISAWRWNGRRRCCSRPARASPMAAWPSPGARWAIRNSSSAASPKRWKAWNAVSTTTPGPNATGATGLPCRRR